MLTVVVHAFCGFQFTLCTLCRYGLPATWQITRVRVVCLVGGTVLRVPHTLHEGVMIDMQQQSQPQVLMTVIMQAVSTG